MRRLALHWQILIGMALGATVGLLLNVAAGTRQTRFDQGLPDNLTEVVVEKATGGLAVNTVDALGNQARYTIDPLATESETLFRSVPRLTVARPELATFIAQAPEPAAMVWASWFKKLGSLFLRMLQMVAVPLIVASLATGILGLQAGEQLGKMFGRTLLYYLITSALAIVTGIIAVNVLRPGLHGSAVGMQGAAEPAMTLEGKSLGDVIFEQIEALIPANPLGALAAPNFLSIIAFTLIFSIFTRQVGGAVAETLTNLANAVFEVMMRITGAIIRLAPVGVALLMAYVTASQGAGVFASLGWYMLAVALALAVHALITLPTIVYFYAKRSPWQFAQAMSPALLTAFSTASSNGTLPLTLESIEHRAKISNRVGSFVLPLGATINMDGTALYEAVAVLFIAQLYHGANLPLSQQIIVAITALLASVGAAGIPHAGLVMMIIILQAVGLPVEMQGIILAVDRVLDMARTTVNVWSDCCGAAVVQSMDDRDRQRQVVSMAAES